ncbi:hypothetical protein A8L34_10330 [Bacillus sp. FJAT-27264]|uniref:hypothetical protein n=1 Tax=Paenibacillus sp. (strain DSM 101736 / FJAT-27264) TaxID=1850362 RepID=UPI0008080E27|nr:hypothetical protein [Bacillus sp. FJAT-27264]OBZ14335.1 hypothetical protein A8L34_10330 [Bacillus sp. FJAT-27264]
MNNKKIPTTLTVLLFSGSVLVVSAMIVPESVNTTVAKSIPVVQDTGKQTLTSSRTPVLKVEAEKAKTTLSDVNKELQQLMTQEEFQQIYDFADKPDNEISESRPMSEDEVNRRLILQDQYLYDGLRPKKPLALKPGQAEYYWDLDRNKIYYPDRPLTDEELLQTIDWFYREAYAMSKRNIVTLPDPKDWSQTEAVALAASSVRKIFGADVSKLEVFANFSDFDNTKHKTWMITFAPYKADSLRAQGKEFWQYTVLLDSSTRTVVDTTAANFTLKRTPISAEAARAIQKDATWIHEATKIVTDKQGETRKITMAFLTDTEVNNKRGMVAVKILLEDGSSYTAELRYPDKTLRCLLYEEANVTK